MNKEKTFGFEFMEKVSCWVLRTGTVTAKNKEEALQLLKEEPDSIKIEFTDNDFMIETEELMEVDNNSFKITD